MAPKLKPSSKEYKKDSNGRMTSKWKWKHYTVASASTKDLLKYLESPSMSKKKRVISSELRKRNAI